MNSHREVYSFTWPGKHEALLEAGKPPTKTLRPCIEESLNFDTTQNLYIEGDNLEAMKIIQRAYMKKIKMIYIDPPYNTGHDFIYRDDFAYTIEKEREQYEFTDDIDTRNFTAGNYFENTRNRPRFHSDWCSMMYPRLKIAHNVLANDGVMFISIDDNEVANLRKICDEIFGEENFIAQFNWRRRSGANDAVNNVSIDHEYIICYSRSPDIKLKGIPKTFDKYSNSDNDVRGEWVRGDLTCGKTASQRPNLFYQIMDPETGIIYQCNPDHVWRFEQSKMKKLIEMGKIIFPADGKGTPAYKRHKSEIRSATKPYSSVIDTKLNSVATRELREILGGQFFDYPKPLDLITQLVYQATNKDSIILDFFSGSATTAQAVMTLNAQDGGKRKFIMIQLPEECAPRSEAAKAGYANICEIGKERIRRAGRNLSGDTGFRVFKLDSSNYNDVYLTAEEFLERDIDDMVENIKPDRTGMDLLFDYAADIGLSLSLEYEVSKFKGFEIHQYGYDEIIACFDENLDEDTIKYIAKLKPKRAIFFESCFENLMSRLNLGQIFRFYAPKAKMIIL